MPTHETLTAFKQGLKVLESASDYISLRETIVRMVRLVSADEESLAKDAIARVLRRKQALELQRAQGYPQAVQELDQKYKDLYLTLKSIKGQIQQVKVTQQSPQQAPQASQDSQQPEQQPAFQQSKTAKTNPLMKLNPLNGLNAPMMVLDWIKEKKSSLILGSAVLTTVGGAYYFYSKYVKEDDNKKKKNPEKDTSFDKTLKSIQKYRLFSQMTKDPSLDDYEALLNGKSKKNKKAIKKKESPDKISEWDYEEKSLMKNMDSTFSTLAVTPKIKYELPQLPKSNEIDPEIAKGGISEKKALKGPRTKKTRGRPKREQPEIFEEEEAILEIVKPKLNKIKKPTSTKKVESSGRLIPIVKRTKRISKIRS